MKNRLMTIQEYLDNPPEQPHTVLNGPTPVTFGSRKGNYITVHSADFKGIPGISYPWTIVAVVFGEYDYDTDVVPLYYQEETELTKGA